MIIQEVVIEGFRCFKTETKIPVHDLTVLIGENDSGKSAIIKSIDLLLNKYNAKPEDFFSLGNESFDSFSISGLFSVYPESIPKELQNYVVNDRLVLKKVYLKDHAFDTSSKKIVLTDNDLEAYQTLNAAALKELLVKYNLPEKSTQAERKLIVKEYLEHEWSNLDKRVEDVTINFNQISPYLPVFQYFGSHDYGNPQAKKIIIKIHTNDQATFRDID